MLQHVKFEGEYRVRVLSEGSRKIETSWGDDVLIQTARYDVLYCKVLFENDVQLLWARKLTHKLQYIGIYSEVAVASQMAGAPSETLWSAPNSLPGCFRLHNLVDCWPANICLNCFMSITFFCLHVNPFFSLMLYLFLLNLSSAVNLWAIPPQATLPPNLNSTLEPLSTSVTSQATADIAVSTATTPVDPQPEPPPVVSTRVPTCFLLLLSWASDYYLCPPCELV